MRIAVEIPYYAQGGRGSYQYGVNLLKGLTAVAQGHEIVGFNYFYGDYEAHRAKLAGLLPPRLPLALPRWPQRLVRLAEDLGYPFVDRHFLRPQAIDVFHHCGPHPVDTRRTATVYTLHGTGMTLAGLHPLFGHKFLATLRRCAKIIVHCEVNRDFLIKYYAFDPERLTFIPFGIDHGVFRSIEDRAALERAAKKYGLPGKFLLCVGPFQFRDNVEHILTVLERRLDDCLLSDYHLVLAGSLEEHGEELRRRARPMTSKGRVHFIGHVSHSDLAAVYNLAALLVHGSYYEELGTVLREAAACGLPILASNAAGNFEGIGDAAVYFNPHLLDDLEGRLREVLQSPERRAEMRRRGIERCRRYTWETAARETLQCYLQAAVR